ncbi:hypothetical protein [Streptobacillus canis]|uniref:hypothetical protein n=1 Tax=Streptobacillus canis TaxID=2678686 RepID=UPI0012E19859|nr:hypothetical protein [Streptobacillus canis]
MTYDPNKTQTIKYENFGFELGPVIKGTLGVKINDRYNIGVFGGYGNKELVGIEAGYKFDR